MEGKYEIHYRGEVVGQASVEQQGLYYSFFCSVQLKRKGMYRVIAFQNKNQTDLGICMPQYDRYVLVKKIPIKNFTKGKIRFVISDDQSKEKFVPISSQEPFTSLVNLEKGRFGYLDGIPGIIFPSD